MNRNLLLITALAAGLAGPLAAHAQQVNPPATDAPPAAPAATAVAPPTDATPPAAAIPATQAAMPASATTDAAQVVSNGPVPDTPANRAKYGKPMSHAGRHTAPAGN
jgi:hypothetical protein